MGVTASSLAYLAQAKLHLHAGEGERTFESTFGRSLRDRAAEIHNRHAWKMEGTGARFMKGLLWAQQARDLREFRIAVTSICRGRNPGEVLYSLETDEISGVFAVDADGMEQRLFHTADFRVRHVAVHPDGEAIALAVAHDHLTSDIAVLDGNGANLREVSEGDSVDLAPHWVPGPGRRLVFQSAGVGRDSAGRYAAIGRFTVQLLDLDSGEIQSVADDSDADLLGPQMDSAGALYYIRRPSKKARKTGVDPLGIILDILMLPLRLAFAIFQFFNFFSIRYTGKPLATSKGAAQQTPDLKQMMVWGNVIDADRAARENRFGDADAPSLVPASWQLIRQTSKGKEVLAKGVLSFDIARDGSVVYSNGSAVHRIAPASDSPERLLVGQMIEQVAAL